MAEKFEHMEVTYGPDGLLIEYETLCPDNHEIENYAQLIPWTEIMAGLAEQLPYWGMLDAVARQFRESISRPENRPVHHSDAFVAGGGRPASH